MNHSTWQQQKWSLAQVKGESKEEFHFGKEKGSSKRRTQSQGASFPVSKCQVPRACVRRKLPFFLFAFPCLSPFGSLQACLRWGRMARFLHSQLAGLPFADGRGAADNQTDCLPSSIRYSKGYFPSQECHEWDKELIELSL